MTTFTDDFNRANNADLGTNWTPVTGSVAWSVSGNAAQADTGGSRCAEYVNTFTPANDQYAQAALGTVDTAPGADQPPGGGPAVRVATGANTYYGALANSLSTSEIELVKVVAGTLTSLGTYTAGAAPVTGDTIRIEASGTTIRVLHNGTERINVSDSSISSGQVGINGLAWNNIPTLDNFDGGDLGAAVPVGFAGTRRPAGAPGPRDRRGFLLQRIWDYTVAVVTNITVATDVGSLVLNGFASVLNFTISAGVGALTLTGFAPSAVVGTVVASNVGALTVTGCAPSVIVGTVVTPGVGALTLTGVAPSAVVGTVITPGVGALTLTGFTPALDTKVNAGVGALTLSGFAPSLDSKIATGVGALTLSGLSPTPNIGVNVQTNVGALTLSGLAPSVVATNNKTASPGVGALTLSGFAPALNTKINTGVGALTLNGFSPTLDSKIAIGVGALTLSGFAPIPAIGVNIQTGVGQLILSGFAPDILRPNPLPFWFSLRSAAMSTFTASTSGAQWTSTQSRVFGSTSSATRAFEINTVTVSFAAWTSTAARQFGWTSTATRQFPWRP
jgi:hypothetical protein